MSKKKLAKSVGAVAVAGAIAVGATLAWQGNTQVARNEAEGIINPGGRLHDDYYIAEAGAPNPLAPAGAVKRVYVENFATQDIFVRVKLREFMETGEGAGTYDKSADKPSGVTVMTASDAANPKIEDSTTWHTYKLGESGPFRNIWEWSLGGEAVKYLPTFNKNKDSVVPDVNGSWEGQFNDYINWADLGSATLPGYLTYVAPAGDKAAGVESYEVYDGDDADTVDEPNASVDTGYQVGIDTVTRDKYVYGSKFLNDDGAVDFDVATTGFQAAVDAYSTAADADKATKLTALQAFYKYTGTGTGETADDLDILVGTTDPAGVPEKSTHYVTDTAATEKVISMAAWLALPPDDKMGDFWVYDTDGWAYWANPLTGGTATGCLLNSYKLKAGATPDSNWYYAIDVDMQCATRGDWGDGSVFQTNSLTDDGEFLLDVISGRADPITGGKIVRTLSEDVCVIQLGSFKKDGAEIARATIPFSANYSTDWFHGQVITNQLHITGNLETYDNTGTYSFGDTPTSEANAIQWVKIKDTEKGKYMYICDRNLLANVTWNQLAGNDTTHALLGAANYAQSSGVDTTIDGRTYKLRLLTGGIYNPSKTNTVSYDGACSTNTANDYAYSEWDRYIGGYADKDVYGTDPNYPGTIKGLLVPSGEAVDDVAQKGDCENEHNKLWNWFGAWSWCQDTVNGTTVRAPRGHASARYWECRDPGNCDAGNCFRPCFEVAIPSTTP